MKRWIAMLSLALPSLVLAQPAPYQTTKLTENVYVLRYGGHQSLFVVTPEGVIATDPRSISQ